MKKEIKQYTFQPEKLMTIKKASEVLGVEYRQLLDGVNSGQINYYQVSKSLRKVLPSEVLSCMLRNNKHEKEANSDRKK